jgi:hypothetical protein
VAQDDKHKEELERDCGDHEEIDRGRTIHVIAEEYLPTLIGMAAVVRGPLCRIRANRSGIHAPSPRTAEA